LRDRFLVRIYIPKAHHAIAGGLQKSCPLRIVTHLCGLGMMRAVEFDDQFCAMTGEVGIVISDLRLSSEVQAMVAQQSKAAPNSFFRFRGMFA
jgi:hypothetical protein